MNDTPQSTAIAGMACEQLPGLFPGPDVYVLTGAVSDDALAFMSEREAALVADAVPKRKREFATARALAREGLGRYFGLHDFDLLNDRDRAPIWPRGIAGSLSHSSTRAWVALVEASYGSIGIDGENRDGLEQSLWHLVLCDEEIAYLETLEPSIRERIALVIYSAKEALYKAQFPRTRKFVDFKAVRIRLGGDGSLECVFRRDIAPLVSGFVAHGRWSEKTEVLTAVRIPSPPGAA